MPIGPKRSGSGVSLTQYTYLPRLPVAASGAARPACTTRSERRSRSRPFPRGAAPLARADSARRPAAAALPAALFLAAGFARLTAPRVRSLLRPLAGGFRIFSAPAGLLGWRG